MMRASQLILLTAKPNLATAFVLGADWTWDGAILTGLGTGGGTDALGTRSVVPGRSYRLKYTKIGTSGLFQVRVGETFVNTDGGSGTVSREYVVVAGTTTALRFASSGSYLGTIVGISLKPV